MLEVKCLFFTIKMKFYYSLGLSAVFPLAFAETSYNLVHSDGTIRAIHDNTICLSNYKNKKVRSETCTAGSAQKWEYLDNTQQVRSISDPTKCWQTINKKSEKRRFLLLRTCDASKDNQKFEYQQGRVSHTVEDKDFCLQALIPGKTVRVSDCDFSNFGEQNSTCTSETGSIFGDNRNDVVASSDDSFGFVGTTVSYDSSMTTMSVVGDYTCQPTFDIQCGVSGCQFANLYHNCQLANVADGFCKNKILGGTPLKVAFWNVQIFGDTKAGKEGVMKTFIKIFNEFDIIGISEMRDSNQSGDATFYNDWLNVAFPGVWDRVYSTRDGTYKPSTGGETGTEQTIWYWRTDKVNLVKHTDFRDLKDHFYVRGPHAAHFQKINTNPDKNLEEFTLVNMHLSASSEAIEQANYLIDIENVLTTGGQLVDSATGDTVGPLIDASDPNNLYPAAISFGGDFNAADPYISDTSSLLMMQDTSYEWLITDSDDTNVASSSKAYDRIVIHHQEMINSACTTDKSESAQTPNGYDYGVLRFTDYWNEAKTEWLAENPGASDSQITSEGLDKQERVSDHWPVWFTIY